MKRIIIIIFCTLLLLSCKQSNNSQRSIIYLKFQNSIDSIFNLYPESVGILAHVESSQYGISWSGCAGYSDKTNKSHLTADQPAFIASSMKPYVAASILKLEEINKLSIEDPVSKYLTERTSKLLLKEGYDLDAIKLKHLLTHTSGIYDYLQPEYFNMVTNEKNHRWTREEQLILSMQMGEPLANPADTFVYTDANYLLAAEIIETIKGVPYNVAMRELLNFKDLEFEHTWFPTLEDANLKTKQLVHQYWSSRGWDSYEIDPSFDLYGGGGMATTTKELAKFSDKLFSGNIIKDTTILNKLFSKIIPSNGEESGYCMGLTETKVNGNKCYNHGGFWGTRVIYFPEFQTSIAVFILEKDKSKLGFRIIEPLQKQAINIINDT